MKTLTKQLDLYINLDSYNNHQDSTKICLDTFQDNIETIHIQERILFKIYLPKL